MLKSFAVTGTLLCFALAAPAARAQDKPNDTKIVVKDDTTPKVKKAGQAVSDASITTAVKTRLMKDKVARGTDIDVDTKDGVVTLTGAVPTAADKARIGHLVVVTSGVKHVENNLTVSGQPAGTSGSSDKVVIKDDTPKVKVKDDTKVVIKDDTTPAVKKGAKEVAHGAKKGAEAVADVATSIAKKTADVSTDAAKKTADVSTDASVAAAVKTHLMKDEVARSTAIDVAADDGVVTITGTVPTAADKVRIGKLAADTAGVKRLVNNLTVK